MAPQRQTRTGIIGDDIVTFLRRTQQRDALRRRSLRRQQGQRTLHPAHLPHGAMPVSGQLRERIAGGERFEIAAVERGPFGKIGQHR